jgi:hypothetical protein
MATTLSECALNYAARGWHVFPCRPRGKTPATSRGFLDATTDAVRVASWWRSAPECNVGIATGKPSGFFALDVDGADGEASLRQLESENGSLPATIEAVTGKGRHCYFRTSTKSVKCSAGIIGAGLDVRGDGGYVLAPPSLHPSGRAYAWSVDGTDEMASAPDWLLNRVSIAGAADKPVNGKPLEHWHRVLTNPIPNGQRNATLTSICGKLFHAGLHDPVLLISTMFCINVARCDPPLAEGDIETIVLSVMRGHFRKISHAGHD